MPCRKSALSLVVILLLIPGMLFLGPACQSLTQRRPMQGATPPPETLLVGLKDQQGALRSFAGKGALKFQDGNSKSNGEVMIAAQAPDRLRFQAFGPMGRPILTMTTQNGQLSVLDHRSSRFLQGPATPENFGRFIPLGLALPDIITILSGTAPVPAHDRYTVDASAKTDHPGWRLGFFRPGFVERMWVSDPGNRVSRVEIGTQREEALLVIEYDNYKEVSGRMVPFTLHLEESRTHSRLDINYEEVKINPDLPEKVFELAPPAGVQAEPIPPARN